MVSGYLALGSGSGLTTASTQGVVRLCCPSLLTTEISCQDALTVGMYLWELIPSFFTFGSGDPRCLSCISYSGLSTCPGFRLGHYFVARFVLHRHALSRSGNQAGDASSVGLSGCRGVLLMIRTMSIMASNPRSNQETQ